MNNLTPILDTLNDYLSKDPVRMHVPFHSGIINNEIFPPEIYNIDISEVSGYDVIGEDNPIYQSEKITADFFNASHSFYLTGGASIGLLASMMVLNKYGKKVLLARNVHKSVINGMILAGLEPIWLDVDFLDEWGIFSKINPSKLEDLIEKNNDIAGCVIVSPTYEGVVSDIRRISIICHKKNIPLIVDEAHGGHLCFLKEDSRAELSALKCGADIVIQSWHKSLGSLTQSGVLHLTNENFFTYYDLKRSLDLVSSTSPSFLLLLSLELTRKHIAETKGDFLKLLIDKARLFRNNINEIKQISLFQNEDPFKIYLRSNSSSGIDLAYELYKNYSIEVESANEIGLLMMIGRSFTEEIGEQIVRAIEKSSNRIELLGLRSEQNRFSSQSSILNPQFSILNSQSSILNPSSSSLREAFILGFRKERSVEYNYDVVAPCPPGYATSIPGVKEGDYAN